MVLTKACLAVLLALILTEMVNYCSVFFLSKKIDDVVMIVFLSRGTTWGFFFRRDIWATFCNMVNIFTYRCPNWFGVGAIDSPDRFEQVLDHRYIPEVSEKT